MSLIDITDKAVLTLRGEAVACPKCKGDVVILRRSLPSLKEGGKKRNFVVICAVCGTKTKGKRRKVDAIHCWEA